MFIYQPVFRNKNLIRKVKGKNTGSLTRKFWFTRKASLCVNKCYNSHTFKSHDELSTTHSFPEGAYLLLKRMLTETYSPRGKFAPPLINTVVQKWSITKLFSSQKKG